MLRQEMNIGYFNFIHRPGEKLGVLDNGSDFESCRDRTHCNATHGRVAPEIKWDEEKGNYMLDDSCMEPALAVFHERFSGMHHTLLGGGEHNNVYFPGFYHYRKNIPEALMQDIDGKYLELSDPDILGGKPIPMPAIDDPTLLDLYAKQLSRQAMHMRGCHYVAGYVMGAEMLYPEYFGLGRGDYRPTFWHHFEAWCRSLGIEVPSKEATLQENSDARLTWLRFREQAMADRSAYYFQSILSKDDTHLCYYPTHGSALHGTSRCSLGQQTDTLIGACDGIEMGHILIDNDSERRNVIMISYNSSYGAPVIVPRLGNKTADLSAAGGGRSFTPETLRRLVYECAGMGISVIYPIHWRSCLHDGEWFIKDTAAEVECRKVFDELTLAAPYTTGMGRLQPQVGILAADDTWLKAWQPRWTSFMQDSFAANASVTIVTDVLVDENLCDRMPLILSIDNSDISKKTLGGIINFLNAGGKMLVWGEFAKNADQIIRGNILSHSNCFISSASETSGNRVVREMFLSGIRLGTCGSRYIFKAVDFAEICGEIKVFAPEIVLKPFIADGILGMVNIYTLTDRASLTAVCVNNGSEEAYFTLRPDPRLLGGDIIAIDAITGTKLDMPISLPGYGTKMIFFAKVPGGDFEETICLAEDAFENWDAKKADVGALRHNYSGMRSGIHKEKRYALACGLLDSLAIKPLIKMGNRDESSGITVQAEIYDANGDIPENAKVKLRIAPGAYRQITLKKSGPLYECTIPKYDLPLVYDPQKMDYTSVTGAVRFIIQAEAGSYQGGCIVSVSL